MKKEIDKALGSMNYRLNFYTIVELQDSILLVFDMSKISPQSIEQFNELLEKNDKKKIFLTIINFTKKYKIKSIEAIKKLFKKNKIEYLIYTLEPQDGKNHTRLKGIIGELQEGKTGFSPVKCTEKFW